MNFKGVKYEFKGKPWQHKGSGGWYFVSLPNNLSIEIRNTFKSEEEGWGRLKAIANIGNSEWKTAIWFDTKANCYLLPLKADIRKKEHIIVGNITSVILWI